MKISGWSRYAALHVPIVLVDGGDRKVEVEDTENTEGKAALAMG